jgi:hypothetical protein
MKKPTNWDVYFRKQLGDPETRELIEGEIESCVWGLRLQGCARKGASARHNWRRERE